MRSGAKIVQSSYDYDTHRIGPYMLPFHIDYIEECCNGDIFHLYQYYQALLADDSALAVFNVNNYCLCVVQRYRAYETDLNPVSKLELLEWTYGQLGGYQYFAHVGFEKSYHDCLAVTQFPTSLLRAANDKNAYSYEDAFDGVPLENPPYALYRTLVNSEAKAVYFDVVSHQPKFLFK